MQEDEQKHQKHLCEKVETSHQIIGKKWVALIVHCLMEEPKRFSEIHAFIPDLSKRVLNERMKELEENGIVLRNVIPERPIRTEYCLTKKGTELGKALKAVEDWALKWL
ncbi:winged helix-turn-helix transcriptional regulator [Paenibacillus sp. 481]|uniref:winged helix-turn-helix transcriptional regulator n=1 Tax=Paenibacillus sp. 481 TaxID=2835869 RepID=UPI001E5E4C1B|nr:helix-turn-helix domain-containing protein [Paenibacillus sp. 481]UHA76050.1 helix-turn-helix transcriptional regulator [Paenibacillus sp. 481]